MGPFSCLQLHLLRSVQLLSEELCAFLFNLYRRASKTRHAVDFPPLSLGVLLEHCASPASSRLSARLQLGLQVNQPAKTSSSLSHVWHVCEQVCYVFCKQPVSHHNNEVMRKVCHN